MESVWVGIFADGNQGKQSPACATSWMLLFISTVGTEGEADEFHLECVRTEIPIEYPKSGAQWRDLNWRRGFVDRQPRDDF